MDEVDSGAIDEVFGQFMSWFADPGIAGRNSDVADMLAAQFGDMGWAASQGNVETYQEVMARRLVDTVDGQSLLAEFREHLSQGGGDEAGAELVDWLADKMALHGWAGHTVPEQDPASGAWYRYDLVKGVYQWEDPRAPGSWLGQEEFSALQVGGGVAEDERYSAPEFDDYSYLWCRYDHGAKTYQWAEADPVAEPGPAAWMSEAEAAQRRRFSAPQMDSQVGTRYRFDNDDGVYQWEDLAAKHTWLSEAEFTARRAWAGAAGAGQLSAPAFDENYGMWYRYNSATKTYTWHTGDPRTPPDEDGWMSQSDADQFRRAAAQTGEASTTPALDDTAIETGVPALAGTPTEPGSGRAPMTAEMAESVRKMREFVVQPSVDEVMSKLPDELKERIGDEELQNLVRRLVVRETAKTLQSEITPITG